MGLNPTKTATFFLRNYVFFRRYLAPTQWAVGDCPPLEESPGRGPAARRKFSKSLVKINDFLMGIVIILIRVVFFD